MNEEAIREWVESELASNLDVIEDLNTEQIHDLMAENEYVMVYLYTEDCEACDEAIKQLEQIDDDADAVGVMFVKTNEADFAAEYGIDSFPAILYFENSQPSIYDGDAAEETELLTWLLYQMKEDTVENINRELLTKMIDEFEFLAVFFYDNSDDCTKVLRHLELIDDEAQQYGVRMVKVDDPLMSKKYGHRNPPGLGYFRYKIIFMEFFMKVVLYERQSSSFLENGDSVTSYLVIFYILNRLLPIFFLTSSLKIILDGTRPKLKRTSISCQRFYPVSTLFLSSRMNTIPTVIRHWPSTSLVST